MTGTRSATPAVTVTTYDGAAAEDQLDVLRPIYAEVYAEPPYHDGPEEMARYLADGWEQRVRRPGFRLVVARTADEAIGFAFGRTLPPDTDWWTGALDPVPAEVTTEWPGRTFGVNELAVRAPWRRRGVARAMHDALLTGRTEQRVTLLVRPEPEAAPARAVYSSWGYRALGRLRPHDGAPIYLVMVRDPL